MLNKYQFLKKLTIFAKTRALSYPALSSKQNFAFSFMKNNHGAQSPKILQMNMNLFNFSFSSSHKNIYQEDFALGKNFNLPPDQLAYFSKIMDIYADTKDGKPYILPNGKPFTFSPADVDRVCTTLINFAVINGHAGNKDKAFGYLIEAKDFYKKQGIKDDLKLARVYYMLGKECNLRKDKKNAADYFNEAVKVYRLHPNSKEATDQLYFCQMILGSIYQETNQINKAIETFNSIIEAGDKVPTGKEEELLQLYRRLGTIYNSRSEFDKSVKLFEKGLKLAIKQFGERSKQAIHFYTLLAEAQGVSQI